MSNAGYFDLSLIQQALDQQHTILVPNTRLRDAIFRELALGNDQQVITSPRIFAIDIWIQSTWQQLAQQGISPCCDRRILNALEEQLLWTRIVEQTLDQFPLLSPTETARSLSHAYQILQQWQLDIASDGTAGELEKFTGIADVAAFQYWRHQFITQCQSQSCINLVDAVQELLHLQPRPGGSEQFALVNFNQPPPLYRQLLQTLNVAGQHLTADDQQLEGSDQSRQQRAYSNTRQEVQACAQWALAKAKEPDTRIGIICPNKDLYQQSLGRELEQQQDARSTIRLNGVSTLLNSVGGPALNNSGLIHDALLILGLSSEKQQSESLCRLLRSPYLLGADEEREARAYMELHMRRYFVQQSSVQRFSAALQQEDKAHACPLLASALLDFRNRLRQAAKLRSALAWSQQFAELLACMGWPGEQLAEQEQLLLLKWQQALENFSRASDLLGPMSIAEALRRLLSVCQNTIVDHGYHPRAQISFYSPTEASGLSFDAIWLLGFTDQNWPTPVSPSPFLPYELQKQHGVPGSHSDVQFEQARGAFYQLCNSTRGKIIASFPREHDNQEIRPSSFIRQFPAYAESEPDSPDVNRYTANSAGRMSLTTCDDNAVALQADEAISGGQQLISDQSACPFRAFARHRLKVDDLDAFSDGLDARIRGTALHKALEYLFTGIRNKQQLEQLAQRDIESHCQAASDEAIDYLQWAQPELLTPALRELERQRIQQLLLAFIDSERQRGDFQILDQEKEILWQFEALQLSLRIDRLDKLGDNSLAVIDYKSGKYTPSRQSWLQERPEDMQLPIYAVAGSEALDEPVSVLALAHINAARIGYSGLAESSDFHPDIKAVADDRRLGLDWQQLQENFQLRIENLAQEIIAGHNPVSPSHGLSTCQYCGLQPLCRIHQQIESHGAETEVEQAREIADD